MAVQKDKIKHITRPMKQSEAELKKAQPAGLATPGGKPTFPPGRAYASAYAEAKANKLTNSFIGTNTFNEMTYPFLAGLLDGDGFIVPYTFTGEYMVTTHSDDLALLEQLKNQFGGDIRKVPNKNAVRFHLNQKNAKCGKDTLILLAKGLNGHIRNTIRVEQFKSFVMLWEFSF